MIVDVKDSIFAGLDRIQMKLAGSDVDYITGKQVILNSVSLTFNGVSSRPSYVEFSLGRHKFSLVTPFFGAVNLARFSVESDYEQERREIELTEIQLGQLIAGYQRCSYGSRARFSAEELGQLKLDGPKEGETTTNFIELIKAEKSFLQKFSAV